jgi:hypothetical protein
MKYIKLFEDFDFDDDVKSLNSDIKDIELYCKDILLELEDIGFRVKIISIPFWDRQKNNFHIEIFIRNKNKFKEEDISDTIYSLDEYLKTQGFYREESSKSTGLHGLDFDGIPKKHIIRRFGLNSVICESGPDYRLLLVFKEDVFKTYMKLPTL